MFRASLADVVPGHAASWRPPEETVLLQDIELARADLIKKGVLQA